MNRPAPPKWVGRTCDAARLETTCTAILAEQLRQINSNRIVPGVWTAEGWRLLSEYQRTRDPRHREAFRRHLNGICIRVEGIK
jgi:hypothetical protein